MTRVLAAIDNSLAASPVLATARALAPLLDSEVDVLHLVEHGDRIARQAAAAAGLRLVNRRGPAAGSVVEAAGHADVAVLVIGARGTPAGPRPLGGTARAIVTALRKPVVVVPPDARVATVIRRVLVPIEGIPSAGVPPPNPILELAKDAELDMVVLHVYEEASLPAFTDQPQHWHEAWAQEFIRRYCDWHTGTLWLETRVGRAPDMVPQVADEIDADIVALGWERDFGPGRAHTVRGVLDRCRRPVLLVPVTARRPN
jgi:nucleotide-binding universal stress UspA family protein